MRTRIVCTMLTALLVCLAPAWSEDDGGFRGSVELLYRNVSQDGSSNKYDEDFDALDSGARLGSLSANWLNPGSLADYARIDLDGLGGEPYESAWFRLGRKDSYELSLKYTKQDYVYDLFDLVPDEDGSTFDSERKNTGLTLTLHPTDDVDLFFQFEDGRRSGDSLFLKDINRNVFRFDAPLDQNVKRYTVGAAFNLGSVDLVFRQTLRRWDNDFQNHTEGNVGLEAGANATLDMYDWRQRETGGTDWTSLKLAAPIGDRVDLNVTLMGTFFGEEELKSRVDVDADGTSFTRTCSLSAVSCSSDLDCEPISGLVGDVCQATPFSILGGNSSVDLDGDTTMIEANVAVRLAEPLELHLQYRDLDRDLDGTALRDLDGDTVFDSVDTRNDYQISTSTATLEYRPMRELSLRAGYRMIDRELQRSGFDSLLRNADYDSESDDTLIFGVIIRPVDWFRLNADYEDGDIEQPFQAVAPQDREHTRVRATVTPRDDMRLDVSYLDYDYRNTAEDIRDPGSFWDGSSTGETWSMSFWQKIGDDLDYALRYARQEVDSNVGITFDTAGFGATEDGFSVFDNDNTQYSGHVNFSWDSPWRINLRYWMAESDGDNLVLGDVTGLVNNQPIQQEFSNAEVGATYSLDSGIWFGASLRDFDYDDFNDLLDYDGQIFTFRLGTAF